MNIVYSCFDVFPSHKGAAIHIDAFARALGRAFGQVELVTIAPDPGQATPTPWLAAPQRTALGDGVIQHGIPVRGPNPVARAMHYRTQLKSWWRGRRARVAHVRSIFEGFPIAVSKGSMCEQLVYEVNALPSIELKYHHPDVAEDRELIAKLEAQEYRLLAAADLVITPSHVTAAELARRGGAEDRIEVIPNGVDEQLFTYRDPPSFLSRELRLIYVGTVTTWQGVHHALEALRLLRRDHAAQLTIVGPMRSRQRRTLHERCQAMGLAEHVELCAPMPQAELLERYHHADVALVPLTSNDRNTVQGCCPLKLIEAMAAGVVVVASDLPVVCALARPDVEAIVVKPSSGKAIKDGLLRLLADPPMAQRLARAARARVEERLTWRRACDRLIESYQDHLGMIPGSPGG